MLHNKTFLLTELPWNNMERLYECRIKLRRKHKLTQFLLISVNKNF